MEKIILDKGEGKTESLIKMSAFNGGYIVCHSQSECSRIQKVAIEKGFNIPFPLTYDEFLDKKYYSKGIKEFLIDNVEMLLERMSPVVPISYITLNKNNGKSSS